MHEIYHLLKVNERKCIFISILSLTALVIIHVLVSTIHVDVGSPIFTMLSTISFALVALLSLLVITKGMVPIVINFLGIVLIYGSIVVPTFERAMLGAVYYKAAIGNITETSLYSGSHGLLFL